MASVNPDMDLVAAYKAEAGDGPVVMVNLFKLKRPAQAQAFVSELRQVIDPILAEVGAETVYAGAAGPELIAGDDWDVVALLRYPDYRAFCDLIEHPVWQDRAAAVREAHLQATRLIVTRPQGSAF